MSIHLRSTLATVLVLVTSSGRVSAQDHRRAVARALDDTARLVYRPSPEVTIIMHADTATWIRNTGKAIPTDTEVVVSRGDSAWLIVRGKRVPLNAARTAMLKRAIESNKQAIRLERDFGRAHP